MFLTKSGRMGRYFELNYLSEPRSDNLPYLKEIYGFRDDNIYLLHVQ